MSDLQCPKCEFVFDYDGDSEGFSQDSEHEFTCPKCNEEFFAIVYWQQCFCNERLKAPSPDSVKEGE